MQQHRRNTLVIIVEDHELLRVSLRKWLEACLPECDYLEAASGEEAVSLTYEHRPEIVLMDVKLPQMSGIEAARKIRECEKDTKIVMLSMFDASVYQQGAFEAGADAYIPKHRMYTELVTILGEFESAHRKNAPESAKGGPDRPARNLKRRERE